ncbi:MAG: aminoacyl-tRNA hydrolase [Erysipelotrichaceae bacterium]|jgi:PTH1 family peptidyl-tRNA hydrolase|nr:aminoacyl-tRNA hydrolase [Bacilli bacterium]NLV29198.1 aminoacyl-tRNA hydrolase [Erysipelotrichaceae bacterium]HPY79970.1 aminoacyl-tRNA hydrolase [Bacilli bacterium]HQA55960.1 aminoacyl-tRNA hydrolase [Bacilli bacterium]
MKLIIGLGNPGKKYEKTRHNMGFMVIDLLSDISKIDVDKEVFHGLLGRGKIFDEDVLLFKPTTFMNLSGLAVSEIVNYFKIDLDDVIIIFDDMALVPGQIRLRKNGSSGGHKGMQNIIESLNSEEIQRIRIGIGEPGEYDTVDYVLGKPLKDEQPLIEEAIKATVDALKVALTKDFDYAMNKFN